MNDWIVRASPNGVSGWLEGHIRAFTQAFGPSPQVLGRAPGRVNILGDHIDYCGGVVLPMAIEHRATTAIARSPHAGCLRVVAADLDETIEVDAKSACIPDDAAESGSWASYVFGAVTETLGDNYNEAFKLTGLDIVLSSDVPVGAGLSSSAAIEVAVAVGLVGLFELNLGRLDIARRCRWAEHRFAGVPCGLMDQAASSLAEEGYLLEFDCQSEAAQLRRLPPNIDVLVLDTGVKHSLAESAYEDRQRDCETACRMLGVGSLREVADSDEQSRFSQLIGELPASPRDAALHVVSEIRRVLHGIQALESDESRRFGQCMTESHASLRDIYKVSCAELDAVVEAAIRCPGVLGARMTGGGFGGCAVALVEHEFAKTALETIKQTAPADSLAEAWVARPAAGAQCTVLDADLTTLG